MNELQTIPYLDLVKQFALAKGLKFSTPVDIKDASALYFETAKLLN